jgi:membrane-associated protease RseP (regulator of RpoE activity)
MSTGNGQNRFPLEVLDAQFQDVIDLPPPPPVRRTPLWWPSVLLFLLTMISTLVMGAEFAQSYAHNVEPFSGDGSLFGTMLAPLQHPHLLLLGIPFSFSLLAFFLAHEFGHFFACKYYGIEVSYPYFIPFPTLFGTLGAVLRIRAPITTRRALFDIGVAGPIAGFLVAVPLMAYAVATSKIVPDAQTSASITFGIPPLMRGFIALFHPGADPASLLLSPVGRAAWVGLLATALNLIPSWQLDGGHILYSLTPQRHQRVSLLVAILLIGIGVVWQQWPGWGFWGIGLLLLSFRFPHPPLFDRWTPLDPSRKLVALVAFGIFLLCFMLVPAR